MFLNNIVRMQLKIIKESFHLESYLKKYKFQLLKSNVYIKNTLKITNLPKG